MSGMYLLRVSQTYEGEVLLEGIVSRVALVVALKDELRRFFTIEFDPQHWDMGGNPEDHEDNYVSIKEHVLSHPWLAVGA
jgi:hypothetical protein